MTRERLHTVEDKEFYNKGTCESWIPLFSNAAVLDEDYRLKYEPRLLDLNKNNSHDMPDASYAHTYSIARLHPFRLYQRTPRYARSAAMNE